MGIKFALAALLVLAIEARGHSSLIHEVDPFIGSAGGGNTFPGAVQPWGMVSVSPHNDLGHPAAYSFGKPEIFGFGHVHLSGVGCPDLGNIVLMPARAGMAKNREPRRPVKRPSRVTTGSDLKSLASWPR
jgi:putative alpha-1,2-mannosidase